MPKVYFRFDHGDWPQYPQGTIIEEPSPELLAAAQSGTTCLELWTEESNPPPTEIPPPPNPES